MNVLGTAIAITAEAFEDRVDKGMQRPYMMHCLFIMNQMPHGDQELQAAAVMHDLVEDTDWTLQRLRDLDFPDRVVELVDRLTHDLDDTYQEYIDVVAACPDACRIKLAELGLDSETVYLVPHDKLRQKDFKLLEKYHRAFAQLTEALKNS